MTSIEMIDNKLQNSLFGKNGDFMLGYKLTLPEKFSLGQKDFDILNALFSKSLKDLPEKSIFLKSDIFKKKPINTIDFKQRNFFEKKRKEYFSNFDYVSHKTYIFFILPNKIVLNNYLKNPFRTPNLKVLKAFDDKVTSFIKEVNNVINYLISVKLSDNSNLVIDELEEEFIQNYYSYYMSGFNDNYNVELKSNWSNLQIGNRYATILRFPNEKEMPEEFKTAIEDDEFSNSEIKFFKGYGDNFSHALKFDHIYNQIAFIDEHKKHLNNAKKNHNRLKSSGSIDPENKKLAEDTEKMIQDIVNNVDHERLIRGHINLIVLADNEVELEKYIKNVAVPFKSMDIKPKRMYGDNLLAVFEYSYPLNCSYFIENHLFVSSNKLFSTLLILTGSYRNDKSGVYFNSRLYNLPVKVDLWDENKKNIKARNGMIIAPTGEGKSVLANHIISDAYINEQRQVIIDLGASYEKIACLFKEDTAYITYKEGESLGLNPFQIIPDLDLDKNGNPLTEKIEDLTDFVGVHYKRMNNMTDLETASIRKIIELYYISFSEPNFKHSFHHFIKYIEKSSREIYKTLEIEESFLPSRDFIFLLQEFGENGIYSNLYKNSDNSILEELSSKKIIIFELAKIRKNKLLLIVMLQLIGSTIKKVIWSDKKTKGRIWFDEVAEVIQWDGMLRRLQWYYQAIRKQESAITVILQAVTQLPENELAKSIITNTQILYVLNSGNYKPIQDKFNLSDHAFYQMNSINSNFYGDRKYSEFLILRGKKHQIYRLELPEKTYWAYQTEGKDNTRLMDIYYQNPQKGMLEAINTFLKK